MSWYTEFINDHFSLSQLEFYRKYDKKIPPHTTIAKLIEAAAGIGGLEKFVDNETDENKLYMLVRRGSGFECFNTDERGGSWAAVKADSLNEGVFTKFDKILNGLRYAAPDSKINKRSIPAWKRWSAKLFGR